MEQGVLINEASARGERVEAQGATKEGINTWQSLRRGRETMPNPATVGYRGTESG